MLGFDGGMKFKSLGKEPHLKAENHWDAFRGRNLFASNCYFFFLF